VHHTPCACANTTAMFLIPFHFFSRVNSTARFLFSIRPTNRRTRLRPPPGSNSITEDTRLLLYALHEQATKGPCNGARPWGRAW